MSYDTSYNVCGDCELLPSHGVCHKLLHLNLLL
jgi:hypothetical protein